MTLTAHLREASDLRVRLTAMDPSYPSAAVGLFGAGGGDPEEEDLMLDAPEHHRMGSPQPLMDALGQSMVGVDGPTLVMMRDPSPPPALNDAAAPLVGGPLPPHLLPAANHATVLTNTAAGHQARGPCAAPHAFANIEYQPAVEDVPMMDASSGAVNGHVVSMQQQPPGSTHQLANGTSVAHGAATFLANGHSNVERVDDAGDDLDDLNVRAPNGDGLANGSPGDADITLGGDSDNDATKGDAGNVRPTDTHGAVKSDAEPAEPAEPAVPELLKQRLVAPQEASHMSLVGRMVEVLWPDDGTWWEAKVTTLNPATGVATLYYPAQEREAKGEGNEAEGDVGGDSEGEIEELNLVEAATNGEVRYAPSELERMRKELEAIAAGGPIAPADKEAVPCPHCDRRAFKYLRSLEKHCWNDHGVRLTREDMESFEKQLRAGKLTGVRRPARTRTRDSLPEIVNINYDELYHVLDDPEEVKKRAAERIEAAAVAAEKAREEEGPAGQRAILWAAAETDLCHVCGEADPDFWGIEGDLIVMCDGCDLQVHLSCYGMTEAPEGDAPWFCQGCIDGVKPGEGKGANGSTCALCPVPGGVVARVQPPSRWSTEWGASGTHAHLCCANNLPEVSVMPSLSSAPVVDMRRVKNSRMTLPCGLCGLSGGCVQCSMKNCFQGFHVLCARAAGLERMYVGHDQDQPAVFFCAEHSAPAFAQRRLKSAGLVAPTGAAQGARGPGRPRADGSELDNHHGHAANEERLAANAAMKEQAGEVERRKAAFVLRLWHRFVPFLPQPADPVKKADLHLRSGRFAHRIMTRAKVPEAEMARLAALTDAEGEAEVKDTHGSAATRAMAEAKDGGHLNSGLRPYQREGVAWLAAQHIAGAGGGILGDDMGLGKTLQVLSFLQYLRDAQGESGPHLVVCPLSVLPTWVTEARRWCPSLRAVAFHGPEAERNRLKQEVLVSGTFDVLVTTYEMLTAEQAMLAARFHFRYLVLDEAQRVKNDQSLVSHAVRRIRSASALLLTGTPLQNNLHELRALVSVLFQDILEAAGAERMDAEGDAAFGDADAVVAARSLLQPLMLRRTKAAVLSADLPPKTETVVRIPLSDSQREWYKTLLEGEKGLFGRLATSNQTSEKEALDAGRCIAEQSELSAVGEIDASEDPKGGAKAANGGSNGNQHFTKLSNLLMQLRKVCCHPFLFGEEVAAAAIAKHGGDRVEALIAGSGKLAALDKMLPSLRAGGHKVLIFSQFTLMLDMLEEFCEARGHAHLRLDGSTSLARRRYETALFNKPDGRHFVYLCSTRAGGLGINLQSADTVILADPDWNPTYDQQAQDRAHRLGQTRPVTVIRMCHASSVEEGILAVAARKAGLAAAVLAGLEAGADIEALDKANAASSADPAAAAKLSFAELKEIIMAGAGAAEEPVKKEEKAGGSKKGRSSRSRQGDESDAKGDMDAQADGAAALARAVEGSGKRGHYQWEGVDYTEHKDKNDKRDIADFWVEQLGSRRRDRVSTIEYVDAGYGLGMQAVSRASLLEAKETEDRERRAAAAREAARARASDRAARHEKVCCGCGGGEEGCNKPPPPFLAPEVAAERLRCRNCPRVMSLGCARLVTRPRMGWQCPQHHCKSCNRTASEAGGLMFRCVDCPTAFCAECNGEAPFDAVEGNPEWEAMEFFLPKSFEYVRCADCCKAKDEREAEEKAKADAEAEAVAEAAEKAAAAARTKGKTRGGAATAGGAAGSKVGPSKGATAKKAAASKKRKR